MNQITLRNNYSIRNGEGNEISDSLADWMEAYFAIEVTTAASSRAVQRRDIGRFLAFVVSEEGTDRREVWTPRLSRAFVDDLRRQVKSEGGRVYSDRTVNRMVAHLKTFAKWIHSRRPFKEREHPMEKLKTQAVGTGLETERAVTPAERRKLLDAAHCLLVIGGRSRNRRLTAELLDERPGARATARGATAPSSTC